MKNAAVLLLAAICFLALGCSSSMTSDLPTAVLLGPVYHITHDALSLSWTPNTDIDFAKYELHRSGASGVTTNDTLIASIADQAITIHRDTDLSVNTEYFYRVWTYDASGNSTPSNETSLEIRPM